MTNKNNDAYRNQPQFETNPALNNNLTPDVPTFKSNAMDNQGLVPLNNCANGCCCHHGKAHDKKNAKNHKHEGCNCNHK